ncbi:MAG: tyrosine-type recombinase/integrase [Reyranella sp.]|nr:tyrosine-type recombinase/integrase [Reyranella sp.]
MRRTEQYKRRIPLDIQGVVIDGLKLTTTMSISLKNGMTRAKAVAFTEDLIARARARVNFKLTDADAWEIASAICDQYKAMGISNLSLDEQLLVLLPGKSQSAREWQRRTGRTFSFEDQTKLALWVERLQRQRFRVDMVESMVAQDDPEALAGLPHADRSSKHASAKVFQSARAAAGRTPLHSEIARDYFAAKKRSKNYKRALEQFREQCGDLEVHQYNADHCWKFRNWLSETLDEKKGEKLAGQTKNHKLSAVRSLFDFVIERRHRNDNPMRDVKVYSKKENMKKKRRLYSKEEMTALFVDGVRKAEWQYWAPLLGIYAGVRITEGIQLHPDDVSDNFGVWHIIIRPGRGQSVKGDKARVVPVHKELIRLGFLELAWRAVKEKREWLFADVPLVKKPGSEFNAPDVPTIMVPSQNAATQWFGRYSDICGVTDRNLDFHALRGTFTTYGSQQGKDLSLRMELVGHSKGSEVHSRYIYAGAPLEKLRTEIDAINYPITIPYRVVGRPAP